MVSGGSETGVNLVFLYFSARRSDATLEVPLTARSSYPCTTEQDHTARPHAAPGVHTVERYFGAVPGHLVGVYVGTNLAEVGDDPIDSLGFSRMRSRHRALWGFEQLFDDMMITMSKKLKSQTPGLF